MFKKLLVPALALAAAFSLSTASYAADRYQTIDVTSGHYPNIGFYPQTVHVDQGDTLHLTIRNTLSGPTKIFIPAFNLNQDIPAGAVANVDLCVSNPIDKVMYMQISSIDAEKIPGYIITNNYQTPIVPVASRIIDTSALADIINYNKNFCYAEKPAPKYNVPKAPSRVRGYW